MYFPEIEKGQDYPFQQLCDMHGQAVEEYGGKKDGSFYPYGREVALQLAAIDYFPMIRVDDDILEIHNQTKKEIFEKKQFRDEKERALEACRSHLVFGVRIDTALMERLSQQEYRNARPMLIFLRKMPDRFEGDFQERTSVPMEIVLQVAEEQQKGNLLRAIYGKTDADKSALFKQASAEIEKRYDEFHDALCDSIFTSRVGGEDVREREQHDREYMYDPSDRLKRAGQYLSNFLLNGSEFSTPILKKFADYWKTGFLQY